MKKSACQILFVAVSILFLSFNLSAQSPIAPVKFRLVKNYLIIVPVQINDTETLEFLLDTGTNTSIIIPEVAAHLNLRPVDRIEMVTTVGSVIALRSFLPRLTFGGHSAVNTEVLWSDLSELRRLDKRISGVLGQNFLAQFNFTLDFRQQRINLADNNQADDNQFEEATRIPFENEDGQILLTMKIGQKTCKLVLDSGASNLIIFASGYQKLQNQIELSNQTAQLSTNAGGQSAQTGWLDRVQCGGKNLRRLQVALLNETANRAADGLLPLSLFRSVYFNNQKGYVILNP
ncbi:MAG: aspartyl protease family protein [Acidobacteriota bacterium]